MSLTILEVLQNADYNISENGQLGLRLGRDQLHNAYVLLEKGYSLHDDFNQFMGKYGDVESVPEKEDES